MNLRKITAITVLSMLCLVAGARGYDVKSPDGKTVFSLSLDASGRPVYTVSARGEKVAGPSVTGFADEPGAAPAYVSMKKVGGLEKVRREWRPLWGKRSVVADRYNARVFRLGGDSPATLEVRVYDEGVAFRISREAGGTFYETTDFGFAGDYTAWYYNGERHNIGPERLSEADGERLPLMTVQVNDGLYLAIHEAALSPDGWPMRLRSEKGSTTLSVIPEPIEAQGTFTSAW